MRGLVMTREEYIQKYRGRKTYLGDSVYVHFDGYHFILETRNGFSDDPSNTIALEPYVIEALLMYRKAVYEDEKTINSEKESK